MNRKEKRELTRRLGRIERKCVIIERKMVHMSDMMSGRFTDLLLARMHCTARELRRQCVIERDNLKEFFGK